MSFIKISKKCNDFPMIFFKRNSIFCGNGDGYSRVPLTGIFQKTITVSFRHNCV